MHGSFFLPAGPMPRPPRSAAARQTAPANKNNNNNTTTTVTQNNKADNYVDDDDDYDIFPSSEKRCVRVTRRRRLAYWFRSLFVVRDRETARPRPPPVFPVIMGIGPVGLLKV